MALVAVSKNILEVYEFYSKLNTIVNIVGSSTERNNKLKMFHSFEIAEMIEINELETWTGLNQVGTSKNAGDTRWNSHFRSITRLLKMFKTTCTVLENTINEASNAFQCDEAHLAYKTMLSFEFTYILHLIKEITEITYILCQHLQCKFQDILNALHFATSTKSLI